MSDYLRQHLPELRVFERGWLSSNNLLFVAEETVLVDSGYCTHAEQTLGLVQAALQGRKLDKLLNTHLHSDHCGGNAILQAYYPLLHTAIPPGEAEAVRHWRDEDLSYAATGQRCPRFQFQTLLTPGTQMQLGKRAWQVLAAPGHDPHSVVLFEPRSRVLISADALWQNGFGVVFPALDGVDAFGEVAATLDLIEQLDPALVIPGHGGVFEDVAAALSRARQRLDSFVRDPLKHAAHGAKVLLKFKLLELQSCEWHAFERWAVSTPYLQTVHRQFFAQTPIQSWLEKLCADLERTGAVRRGANSIENR